MKNYQMEFIELNSLMKKFSIHIERSLATSFFQQYKKLVMDVYFKLPNSDAIIQHVKILHELESNLKTENPGTFKLELQKLTIEIVKELEVVNSEMSS